MPTNGVFYSQTKGLTITTNSINRVFVQTGGTTTFTGNTSGSTIVEVQGTSGQVMKVTDCTNGVLFSSNNVSGTPILQTNSCGSIIGGFGSSSSANSTTIGGGCNNSTTANFATIGGGCNNNTTGTYSTVSGGKFNSGNANFAAVGGGEFNCVSACYATIGGGRYNINVGNHSTIGGGCKNTSSNCFTTIGGGRCNISSGPNSTIGGGCNNISSGYFSTIGGGYYNVATSNYSAILNGACNCIDNTSAWSVIGTGFCNKILNNSNYSGILGGCNNYISNHPNAFIIGSNISSNAPDTTFMNNLYVCGNFTATGSKSFTIKHPDKEKENTHILVHSVIETPTAGDNLYRYIVESDGIKSVKITLPDYFGYLNKDIQIWVNASDNFGTGYGVIDKDLKTVEVFTNTKGHYNVLIIGTRKDKSVSNWKGPEIEKNK